MTGMRRAYRLYTKEGKYVGVIMLPNRWGDVNPDYFVQAVRGDGEKDESD